MNRKLSDYEVVDVLNAHQDIREKVREHEQLFGYYGWQTWDQLRGDVDAFGIALPIPPRGLVVQDAQYGTVVVYPDANGYLRYTTTDNPTLAAEVQKPVYTSDPDYWQLFEEIANKYKETIMGGASELQLLIGAALVLGVVVLVKR